MAEAAVPQDEAPATKRSKLPLVLGLVLALVGGGGGFYVAWSGLLPGGDAPSDGADVPALPDVAFVPLDPLIINLGSGGRSRHLRFGAQIEVEAQFEKDVAKLRPRLLDLLNGYLRAVDPAEFDDPAALLRMRAQLLRRIQMIAGDGRVRDLLVTEFVLN
jgi:flagellar FliL protein